jgi:hypothetical protein
MVGRGNLFALKRLDLFKRRVTKNLKQEAFCFKADIKHYFQEVNHEVLLEIIGKKVIDLIVKILENDSSGGGANEARNAFRKFNEPILCYCILK